MKEIIIALLAIQICISIINHLKLKSMGQELDTLVNEVSETKTIMASAKVLILGFKDRLDKAIASGNPEKLKELSTDLDTGANELAAAVTDNTPAVTEEPI